MRSLLVLHDGLQLNPIEDGCIIDFYEKYPDNKSIILNVNTVSTSMLYRLLCKCDDVAFQTNFDNICQIETFISLIQRIENKTLNIFVYYIGLRDKLNQLYDVNELDNVIRNHNIFELYEHTTSKFEISLIEDLKYFKQQQEKYLQSNYSKKHNFTGRQIKILEVITSDPEYNELTQGEIVNELNCDSMDSKLEQGVWVWGKSHAVKLINKSYHKEYQIIETTLDEAISNTIKIFSNHNYENTKTFVNKILNSKLDSSTKSHLITDFIGINDLENRAYITHLIENR